jgi:hypothetical protein
MLFQVAWIQPSDRWMCAMRKGVDMAVERIGDAAHMPADAKGG